MMIYIVTSGHYSDYRIEAVFDSSEKAHAYIAQRNEAEGDDSRGVEEYEVNSEEKAVYVTVFVTRIRTSDGAVEQTWNYSSFQIPEHSTAADASSIQAWSCESAEHSLKLAAEARQKWLRENI